MHFGRDSYYVPGLGKPEWPQKGALVYSDWDLHKSHHYFDRLRNVTIHNQDCADKPPFSYARLCAWLAFAAYNTRTEMKNVINDKLHSWKLVAHESQDTLEALDSVWMVQQNQSLDCIIVFTGTSNPKELTTSISQYSTGYCDFPKVHAGYRNKLYWLTKGLWPKLRSKLAKCNRVSCTGHSLGGALCDIWSACANSKRSFNEDYKQQMWMKEAPQALPEVP